MTRFFIILFALVPPVSGTLFAQDFIPPAYEQALREKAKGDREHALAALKTLAREHPDFHRTYGQIAGTAKDDAGFTAAEAYFESLLYDEKSKPYGHYGLALLAKKRKNYDEALRRLEKAMEIMPEKMAFYFAVADVFTDKAQMGRASADPRVLEEGVAYVSALKTASPKAKAAALGSLYFEKGDYKQSLFHHETLLASAETALFRGEAHFRMGNACQGARDYPRALAHYGKAREILEEKNDKEFLVSLYYNVGRLRHEMGEFSEAIKSLRRSLSLIEEVGGGKDVEAAVLSRTGLTLWALTEHEEAAAFLEKGRRAYEALGNFRGMARTLNNLGLVHQDTADYPRAQECFQRSLEIDTTLKNKLSMGYALGNLAALHRELGDSKTSSEYYRRALRIFEDRGDEKMVALVLIGIGTGHVYAGDFSAALETYERALEKTEKSGDKYGAAAAMNNMSVAARNAGDHPRALELVKRAVALHETLETPLDRAPMFASLSEVYWEMGKYAEAAESGERALAAAREADAPEDIRQAETALGRANAALGRRERAAAHFRNAVKAVEGVRSGLTQSGQKAGFLGARLAPYESLVELLVDSYPLTVNRSQETSNGQPSTVNSSAEAFAVAERMKARSFLDELGAAKFARAGVPEKSLQEKRALEARIKWLRERAGN